jgi:hypothetical protein
LSTYRDYCNTEKEAGRKPASMKEWAAARDPHPSPNDADSDPLDAAASAVAEAEAGLERESEVQPTPIAEGALAEPVTPATTEHPERIIFKSINRFRRETVQAGEKIVINNQVVTRRHVSIEFNEGFWVADMSDPEDRMKAEWLLERLPRLNGEIFVVPEVVFEPRVEVRTGPRTSVQHTTRVARPAGPLSAAIPE